jgi:chromosome segregation ATPase
MDESPVRPGFPGDRSQAASEKLRALRERANQALESHRSRLGELETQLNERVRQLAEEFGASLSAAPPGADPRDAEIAELRRQVEEGAAKHHKFVEQLAAARKQFEAIQSQPCVNCDQATQRLAAAEEELHRLREQLEAAAREHQADCARHEKFVEQLAAARQAINVLQHAAGENAAELRAELESLRAAKTAAEEKALAASRDLEALQLECDAMRQQTEALEKSLDSQKRETVCLQEQTAALDRDRGRAVGESQLLRGQVNELETALADVRREREELARLKEGVEKEKQAIADALAKLESRQASAQAEQSSLVEMLASAEAEAQDARRKQSAAESDKLTMSLSLAQAESVASEFRNRLNAAEAELESLRGQASAGAEASALRAKLAQAQAAAEQRAQATQELAKSLEDARAELESLRESMVSRGDLESARRECQAAQAAIAELQAALAAAQSHAAAAQADVAAVRESSRPAAEFVELEQKFDLALTDVQKLKRENSALREELAQRPAASDDDPPELIAVRTERDALASRVAALEAAAAAAPVVDPDARQERDDLQRRFEMAVDDVRQLKQENAKLRDQLAASSRSGGGAEPAALGSDWASQKARLMAMLAEEDETGELTEQREAERATVAKTIAATDRVIADKDKEIAELRTALEARGDAAQVDAEAAALRDEVLNADELIAAERQRLAQLNAEWEDKLRAAELEFSVERAKLAREQAALRDRMLELQSAHAQLGDAGDGGKPRRRWRAALGLQDESDEGPKK